MFVNISNSIYCLYNNDLDKALYLFCINSVLALLFFIPYKLKVTNLEVVYGSILLLWVAFSIFTTSGNVVDYSILVTYCIMLIIKNTKIKILPIVVISLLLLLVLIVDMTINDGHVVRMVNNLLLIGVMCLVHYYIYYKEYITTVPNIKELYNLNKKEIEIIDLIINTNPSNKEMADILNKTPATLNSQLNTIYDKFQLPSSGNRKTDLVLHLAKIKYIQ